MAFYLCNIKGCLFLNNVFPGLILASLPFLAMFAATLWDSIPYTKCTQRFYARKVTKVRGVMLQV